jgi:hypothetical protein
VKCNVKATTTTMVDFPHAAGGEELTMSWSSILLP